MTRGIILAAANSGAGKTTLTLGLLRALKNRGLDVRAAKSGPDYIDPAFHAVACGHTSINLDAWAMSPETLRANAANQGGDFLIIEGAMGVLDAGADHQGSVADLANILNLPIVMVLDIAKQAQSAALSLAGLSTLRPEINIAGTILNRTASDKHIAMAQHAINMMRLPSFGYLTRNAAITLPERHLGLVQAAENPDLDHFLNDLASILEQTVNIDAILAATTEISPSHAAHRLPPLGQDIAIANDLAFSFTYPHLLNDWRAQGATIHMFSPLANETPAPDADAIYLPGGYPELHAEKISNADKFTAAMQAAAQKNTLIYGECGGYMVLGDALIDATGATHKMLGLLPLTTTFATRKLSLGYRRLMPLENPHFKTPLMAHEFHYSTIQNNGVADPLFAATDATRKPLPNMGMQRGRTIGSYAHIIAPA